MCSVIDLDICFNTLWTDEVANSQNIGLWSFTRNFRDRLSFTKSGTEEVVVIWALEENVLNPKYLR